MKNTLTILSLFISLSSFAHDGDHGPGQAQPTKGGVIQKTENFHLEIVGTNTEVKFYPMKEVGGKSLALKPLPLSEIKLSASFVLPREKKATPIELKPAGDHFVGKLDAKKSHRYQLNVATESHGHKDNLTYQIEPQE